MKPKTPDIRERCWAARAYMGNNATNKAMEMAAFMSIFHPEIRGRKLKKLLANQQNKGNQ